MASKGIKGFGARYGRKVRSKLGKFLALKNQPKKCPYCAVQRVTREAAGIWHCRKCQATFTGRAYTIEGRKE